MDSDDADFSLESSDTDSEYVQSASDCDGNNDDTGPSRTPGGVRAAGKSLSWSRAF